MGPPPLYQESLNEYTYCIPHFLYILPAGIKWDRTNATEQSVPKVMRPQITPTGVCGMEGYYVYCLETRVTKLEQAAAIPMRNVSLELGVSGFVELTLKVMKRLLL